MDAQDNHYTFLGLDIFARPEEVAAAVERLSKQANALANTSPERSQYVRERLRQIKTDLLTSDERRRTYNRWLLEAERDGPSGEVPVSARSADGYPRETGAASSARYAPEKRSAAAQSTVRASRRRGARMYWIVGTLTIVILAAAGGAYARGVVSRAPKSTALRTATALPTTAPTPTSTSTPNPAPTSTSVSNPTAAQVQPGTLIRAALVRSNQAYVRSMACACDSGLAVVKTGADLQKYLGQIHDMQSNGVRRDIASHSFSVNTIMLETAGSAIVTVTKDETTNVYQNGALTQICEGPYQVQYQLVKQAGSWKVNGTTVLGGGQNCHSP